MVLKKIAGSFNRRSELLNTVFRSGYYLGSSVIGIVVSFITFPLYAILLTKEEFGILAFFSAVGTIMTPFSVLSLTNYYIVRFGELGEEEQSRLFKNIIYFNFFWNLIIAGAGGLILYLYLRLTGSGIEFFPDALFALVILLSQSFITFMAVRYRMTHSGLQFMMMQVAQILGNAILGLSLIWFFNLGSTGKLAGIALSNILVALIFGWGMIRELTLPDMTEVREGLREMKELTFASFLHSTVPSADIVVLETYNNLPGLGVYSVGKQIANFVSIAGASLFQAFEPKLYEDMRRTSLTGSTYFRAFIGLTILMIVLYFLFSDIIISVLTAGKFYESLKYSNILVFQAFSSSLIQAVQVKLYVLKKVKHIAGLNLAGSLLTFLLIFPLTDAYLFTGAAASFLISSVLQVVMLAVATVRYGRN